MRLFRGVLLVSSALALLMFCRSSRAQSFAPIGGLDCNPQTTG